MPAPNVTEEENKIFGKFPLGIRQFQYCKKILVKDPGASVSVLKGATAWKFGKCILKTETLKKLVSGEIESLG